MMRNYWFGGGIVALAVSAIAVVAWAQGSNISPLINDLSFALENHATDIATATTSDRVLILDVSDTPDEVNWGDGDNIREVIGITSTAAELNILDGVTATAAELNYLDIVTLGTGAASKAVVLDAGDDYTWPAAGVLTYGGGALNATGTEINQAADLSANNEAVTGANTITAAECGETFFLNSATGFASTLPTPTAGCKFKFIVTTQPTSGNHTVVTSGGSNVIEGMADVNSTLVLAANEDSINFIANTTIVADWVEVVSDGTSWFVNGASGAAGGITFTVT